MDALQVLVPGGGEGEGVLRFRADLLRDEDAPGAGNPGDPAGEVDRRPEEVPAAAEHRAARDPGPDQREAVSLLGHRLEQVENRAEQGLGVG